MADNYKSFCETPQEPISKPPDGPKYSTSKGVFDGTDGYPKRTGGTVISEKTEDLSFGGTPTDETRPNVATPAPRNFEK